MRRVLAALCLAAAPFGAAGAAEWRVEDAASSLEFAVTVNGQRVEGRFPSFSGEGSFDPDAPGATRLELRVALDRLDMGNFLASAFARSEGWFFTERHPDGVFRLTSLERAAGEDAWLASGTLELRGVIRPVQAPLTLVWGLDTARAAGETVINRSEFGIGQGPSAVLVEVDEAIRVRFDLVARAAPN